MSDHGAFGNSDHSVSRFFSQLKGPISKLAKKPASHFALPPPPPPRSLCPTDSFGLKVLQLPAELGCCCCCLNMGWERGGELQKGNKGSNGGRGEKEGREEGAALPDRPPIATQRKEGEGWHAQ